VRIGTVGACAPKIPPGAGVRGVLRTASPERNQSSRHGNILAFAHQAHGTRNAPYGHCNKDAATAK
jgi:hypothetical protein